MSFLTGIAKENKRVIDRGEYFTHDGKRIKFSPVTQNSLVCQNLTDARSFFGFFNTLLNKISYLFTYKIGHLINPKSLTDTNVEVLNEDCLYAAEKLVRLGKKVAVVNNANQHHAGGGYLRGAPAQEEDLCRRIVDLFGSLKGIANKKGTFYGIESKGCIYTSNAVVRRDGKDKNYRFIKTPFKVDVITSAAPDLRGNDNHKFLDKKGKWDQKVYENFIKEKIRWQFKTAIETGHDAIVLSAFGCGAFKNDPAVVSRLYREVYDKEFKGQIKMVHAILGDKNYQAFRNVFNLVKPKPLASSNRSGWFSRLVG
ncbi:MAG: TIGR02452 family protein [Parachlamydiales bacterium]|nr:TIGR02452 family protein [Parachlamydiales bacterium]